MKLDCQTAAQLLAEDLESALSDPVLNTHLEECSSCRELLERLQNLDRQLAQLLPGSEPPPDLVRRTLQAVSAEREPRRPKSPWRKLAWAGVPLVLLLLAGGLLMGPMQENLRAVFTTSANALGGEEPELSMYQHKRLKTFSSPTPPEELEVGGQPREDIGKGHRPALLPPPRIVTKDMLLFGKNITSKDSLLSGERTKGLSRKYRDTWAIIRGVPSGTEEMRKYRETLGQDKKAQQDASGKDTSQEEAAISGDENQEETEDDDNQEKTEDDKEKFQKSAELLAGTTKGEPPEENSVFFKTRPPQTAVAIEDLPESDEAEPDHPPLTAEENEPDNRPLDELEFIPARGYFENTYLPGDPEIAWLRRRMQVGLEEEQSLFDPSRVPRPYRQPFDAPANRALALYVSADRASLEKRTRLLIQVGIKGAERRGQRANVYAAVVVDLRNPLAESERLSLWSLVDELAQQKSAGDRFWLLAVGPAQPLLLEPAGFNTQSARRVLAEAVERQDTSGSLAAALGAAYERLAGHEEDDPLAERLVILASASAPLASNGEADTLADEVQRWAIGGIYLSLVAVGEGVDSVSGEKLALAGQGRRWLVWNPERARRVAEAELSAAGRVVARALRLTIHLPEKVRLVEVLGSRPLSQVRSQREREVEQAIDRRVARQLGIEADRGQDTDGIQMIIPAFYAGDDHVILLDVVAEAPGRLAEVELRYKDLVFMRNATERAALKVGAGERLLSPLEISVSKNALAWQLSRRLLEAAESLEQGQVDKARQALGRAATAVEGFRHRQAAFFTDAELAADARFLAACLNLLGSTSSAEELRQRMVVALAYSGRVKLPPGDPAWRLRLQ